MDFFSLLQHRHHHQRYAQYTGYAGKMSRGMPLALMIAANNFPTHHMLPAAFSYYTTWHNNTIYTML